MREEKDPFFEGGSMEGKKQQVRSSREKRREGEGREEESRAEQTGKWSHGSARHFPGKGSLIQQFQLYLPQSTALLLAQQPKPKALGLVHP